MDGNENLTAVFVDWPGLGNSDQPKLDCNGDVMEKFLVDFINSPSSPLSGSGEDLVVVGGGHAATIAVLAAKKGLLKPRAIVAVAPTWAGPLPIVFGRDSSMDRKYGLLRGTSRAPAPGWMMYTVLVSASGAPKRPKAEMEALRGAKGVSKFVEVPGALLPQEEYPKAVAEQIHAFLQEI